MKHVPELDYQILTALAARPGDAGRREDPSYPTGAEV